MMAAGLLLISGCNIPNSVDSSASVDYLAPAVIEYTISGGIGGIHEETTIDENGVADLSRGRFIVRYQLTEDELDSLKMMFDQADFFNLKDEYIPSQPVDDGFRYSITYTTDDKSKTVIAEDGANYPRGLEDLLVRLRRTNGVILSNPDAGTLVIRWEYMIKEWPFSHEVSLADNLQNKVYYTDSELSRDIFNFLSISTARLLMTFFLLCIGRHTIFIKSRSRAWPFHSNRILVITFTL